MKRTMSNSSKIADNQNSAFVFHTSAMKLIMYSSPNCSIVILTYFTQWNGTEGARPLREMRVYVRPRRRFARRLKDRPRKASA
ncbi:hypothetical protein [Peribacillus muralis]|uniref:hypothetical protein n=1 Tax=Peribacillus muralis TaxID=264697 RepID=UPI003671C75E